jgi:hypothetical protein
VARYLRLDCSLDMSHGFNATHAYYISHNVESSPDVGFSCVGTFEGPITHYKGRFDDSKDMCSHTSSSPIPPPPCITLSSYSISNHCCTIGRSCGGSIGLCRIYHRYYIDITLQHICRFYVCLLTAFCVSQHFKL